MRAVGNATLIALLAFTGSCAMAATWVWQADNHSENTSYFTDQQTSFQFEQHWGGEWRWDNPLPGALSFKNTAGWEKDNECGWGLARSSDFGEALDLRKGITLSARVKPVSEHSQYSLCLYVDNASTVGLPGDSTHLYVGWAVPDWIRLYDKVGRLVKHTEPTVRHYVESEWFTWTIGAKRIGDTVAWDIWLNGELQQPDAQAPDGTLHTLVYTLADASQASYGTYIQLGLRHPVLYVYDSIWDYVALTNDGVIPAWDGGDACTKTELVTDIPSERESGLLEAVYNAESLMKQANHAAAQEVCTSAMNDYAVHNDFRAEEALIVFKSRIAKATVATCIPWLDGRRYRDVVSACENVLRDSRGLPGRYEHELAWLKIRALQGLGRVDEGVEFIRSRVPPDAPFEQKVDALHATAMLYYEDKRYSEAASLFRRELTLRAEAGTMAPEHEAKVRYCLGGCYKSSGDVELAQAYMAEVCERFAGTAWGIAARGALAAWVPREE